MPSPTSSRSTLAVFVVLAVAALLRLWAIDFGLPGRYRPDEEYVVAASLRLLRGDPDPLVYYYPSFIPYVAGAAYAARRMDWLAGSMSASQARIWKIQCDLRQNGHGVIGCKRAAYRSYADQSKNK